MSRQEPSQAKGGEGGGREQTVVPVPSLAILSLCPFQDSALGTLFLQIPAQLTSVALSGSEQPSRGDIHADGSAASAGLALHPSPSLAAQLS